MDKLFQMLSNSMEKQQQQQDANNNTSTPDNSDDVMRFFRNITPPPSLNNSAASLNNVNNNNNTNITKSTSSNLLPIYSTNKIHNGIRLYGKNVAIDSSKISKETREIESQTLTIIASQKENFLGNYITTNTNYICYIIKGKVRILDGSSSNKALIKNESKDAIDVQFHSEGIDMISVCTDSDIFVYSISKGVGGDSIQTTLMTQITHPSGGKSFSFVIWHPTVLGVIAVCPSENSDSKPVLLYNIHSNKPSEPVLRINGPNKETIFGVCFNHDGSRLAICTNEGTVNVYDTSDPSQPEPTLVYSKKYPGGAKKFRFVQFVDNDVLLLSTAQTEILLVRLTMEGDFDLIQSITFRPNLHQDYNLVAYRDQYLLIADSVDNKCYCLHLNIPSGANGSGSVGESPYFDFLTHFDFKSNIYSFTLKSFPYDSQPSNPMMMSSQQDSREQKNFYIYSFQSNAVYRYRITLPDHYLDSDEYTMNEYAQQFGHIDEDASGNSISGNNSGSGEVSIFKFLDPNKLMSISSNGDDSLINEKTTTTSESNTTGSGTTNPSGNQSEEDVDMILLTPKSFSSVSSPPPVSLPDPDLSSIGITKEDSDKKEKKKKRKEKRSGITADSVTTTLPISSSPNLSSSSTSPIQSPIYSDQHHDVESPSTSGITIKKKSKESSSTSLLPTTTLNNSNTTATATSKPKSATTPTTTTATTTTSPTPTSPLQSKASKINSSSTPPTTVSPVPKLKTEKSNVTPSFIPPPLNIPVLNPPHKSSSASTSTTSLLPTSSGITKSSTSSTNISPPPTQSSINVDSNSSYSSSEGNIQLLFKDMENNLFNRLEKSMINQFNLIEKERLERENLEREKQEKLLAVVHQTIQTTVKTNLEKIVKKELSSLLSGMEKTIQTGLETSTTKITTDYLKKITTKATEQLSQQLKATITSEQFETLVKNQVENTFITNFKGTLIPGFEKSCKEMFKHLSFAYQKGFNENIQHQTLSTQSQHIAIQKSITDEFKVIKDYNDSVFQNLLKDREQILNEIKSISQQYQNQQQQQQLQQQHHQQQMHHQQQQQQQQHSMMFQPQPPQQRTMSGSTGMPEMMSSSGYGSGFIPNVGIPQLPSMTNLQSIPSPQIQSPLPTTPTHQQQQQIQQQQQPTPTQTQVVNNKLSQYPQLKVFTDKGDYVNAFNYSLNASNLTMVTSLCSALDPITVFSKQPPLPQNTILSLIQQLTIDLTNTNSDPEVKLRWIKEGLTVFDISNCARPDVAKKIFVALRNRLDQPQIQNNYPYFVQSIKNLIKD